MTAAHIVDLRSPTVPGAMGGATLNPQFGDLRHGAVYRVVWPAHYNKHQATTGLLGEFAGWRDRRCALHGERIGREAEFVLVKASGRRGYRFAVPFPFEGAVVTEAPTS